MLELRELSRRFGDRKALDRLSLSVAAGQICGFVGRNGAGKTTAMRIVLGLLEADSGEVRWDGRRADAEVRRRFGYMPEERGLYPKMRVVQQLTYLARLHGLDATAAEASARRWIERLGVASRAGDRIEELSLGNQQRVQLAAALVHDPVLLVLDEPFSGLDPVGVDALAAVIRAQARDGVPVLFSSHQLELVERMCQTVVIVDRGRMVAAGGVEELRDRAGGRPRVRVALHGDDECWLDRLEGVVVLERGPGFCTLELKEGMTPDRVLDAARAAGTVVRFEVVRPTVADLFREAVREPAE